MPRLPLLRTVRPPETPPPPPVVPVPDSDDEGRDDGSEPQAIGFMSIALGGTVLTIMAMCAYCVHLHVQAVMLKGAGQDVWG
jgi:hypothetical protein